MCECVRVRLGWIQNVVVECEAVPRNDRLQRKGHYARLLQVVFKSQQVIGAKVGVIP